MLGVASLAALQTFLSKRGAEGETVLLRAVNCLQGAKYIALAEQNAKDRRFVYGWIAQRIS
jgi:lysozyme family protein